MAWNIDVPKAEYYDLSSATPFRRPDGSIVELSGPLQHLINELEVQDEIAIDTETTGLVSWQDIPLYFSVAWGRRRATVHARTLPYFKHIFEQKKKRWLLANAKYDAHILANVGIEFAGELVDVQVMHALIYDEQSHKLKDIAQSLLGWRWSDFQDTFGKIGKKQSAEGVIRKAEVENFDLLVEYAANDAWGTLEVGRELRRQLERIYTDSLFVSIPPYIETLWDLFNKTEVPYTKVLWNCERNGILVDQEYLSRIGPTAAQEIEKLERSIVRESGATVINPNSSAQLLEYFLKVGAPLSKMTKGGKTGVRNLAMDAEVLSKLSSDFPVAGMVLRLRDLSKLKGTYIDGLNDLMDPNGRIHTKFNQDIARCLPAGELVLTNRGYLPVEQVTIGDSVISHTGKPRRVTERSVHTPKPIYRVTLSNGLILRTTGNHQYRTNEEWTRADKLKIGQPVTVHSNKEQWLPIKGWIPFEVSSWGRVRNTTTGIVRAFQTKDEWGHLKITLYRNGAQVRGPDKKDFSIHQLVLQAFEEEGVHGEVRHLNGISWDNTIGNLKYGTSQENTQDALRHGTLSQRRAGRTILTEKAVHDIRSSARPAQGSPTAKLNFHDAMQLREAWRRGETTNELADRYNVSYQAAHNIISNKTYRSEPIDVSRSAKALADKYGVSEGYIREIQSGAKWKPEDYIEGVGAYFFEAHITSVIIEPPETTYGLTVDGDHSHVTGGIVTHNTGRLSSSDPNMQNIPRPENDKWKLRGAFIAPHGNDLIVADYEQLEMRLLAAGSREEGMCEVIRRGWDIHMGNASMIYDVPYEEVAAAKKIEKDVKSGKLPKEAMTERVEYLLRCRAEVKTIGFGLVYGMGDGKLARDLNITKLEASEKSKNFMAKYPAIASFKAEQVDDARRFGSVFTIMGRRRNLPAIHSYRNDDRSQAERMAVNTPIQGSAADVVRMAQLLCFSAELDYRYGAKMLLQVHDELVFQCPKESTQAVVEEIREYMEHPFCIDLDVPLGASIGTGHSWMDAK